MPRFRRRSLSRLNCAAVRDDAFEMIFNPKLHRYLIFRQLFSQILVRCSVCRARYQQGG